MEGGCEVVWQRPGIQSGSAQTEGQSFVEPGTPGIRIWFYLARDEELVKVHDQEINKIKIRGLGGIAVRKDSQEGAGLSGSEV